MCTRDARRTEQSSASPQRADSEAKPALAGRWLQAIPFYVTQELTEHKATLSLVALQIMFPSVHKKEKHPRYWVPRLERAVLNSSGFQNKTEHKTLMPLKI